jgi:hypothetical protein
MFRPALIAAGSLAMASCGGRSDPPAAELTAFSGDGSLALIEAPRAAPRPFHPAFIPEARGKGNFVVCLARAEPLMVREAGAPQGLVFRAWGRLAGSLLDAQALADPAARPAEDRTLSRYAVITTEAIRLTPAEPCRRTTVRAAVLPGMGWTAARAPAGEHLLFQALPNPVEPGGVFRPLADRWRNDDAEGLAIDAGLVNGAAVADIAEPVVLKVG